MHATIGDNSHDLTPAERKAIYMDHFNKIIRQTAVCRAENEIRKTLRKEAKAAGIALRDIDFGIRCATIEDPQVIVDERRRHDEIGAFFALPLGSQSEFGFEREPLVDRATREGDAAGFQGKDRDPPYDPNSDAGRAWIAAWDDAQAQMLEALRTGMEKANAARAKAEAAAKDDDGSNDPE